jgi:NADH-quinone oxidoreductase subunit H
VEGLAMVDILLATVSSIVMIFVALFLGIIYLFLVRKLSARFQWRVGPLVSMYSDLKPLLGRSRILQPLYDILKLFGKQTLVPNVARKWLFISAPYLSFLCAFLAIFFIPFSGFPLFSELGDSLLITYYLLVGSVFFTIVGAASSGSPWSAIGARREVEIFLIYEIGLVVAMTCVAIVAGSLSIWNISTTGTSLPFVVLNPFAAVLFFLVAIGKLAIKPLDMAEAETEIVAGPFTEYSGKHLGMFQLAKVFLFYDVVALFIALFLGPLMGSWLWIPGYILAAIVVIFFLTVFQVLHPRWRIDRAMASYGTIVTIFAILSVLMTVVLLFYVVV